MDLSQSILIIGDSGLLGQALVRELTSRDWTHRGLSRHSKDIRCDALDHAALSSALAETTPEIIINAAGLIDIAACDSTPEQAWLANARLPMQLAEYSKQKNCYLIQVSTDHYYIGDGATPHDEKSTTTCVNEYARSKLAGEILALSHNESLVLAAFSDEWVKLGGAVVQRANFTANPATYPKLRATIANSGADMLFLAADAQKARAVRPYLDRILPVYATSQVYGDGIQTGGNHDLNQVRFVEMPWFLKRRSLNTKWGSCNGPD